VRGLVKGTGAVQAHQVWVIVLNMDIRKGPSKLGLQAFGSFAAVFSGQSATGRQRYLRERVLSLSSQSSCHAHLSYE
jgi:hypothetical protein